jgi:hypothetical protein
MKQRLYEGTILEILNCQGSFLLSQWQAAAGEKRRLGIW